MIEDTFFDGFVAGVVVGILVSLVIVWLTLRWIDS